MHQYKLGVNIDHVATIRNARGGIVPSITQAGIECEKAGADSITVHLREDQRHIRSEDVKNLKKILNIPLNLEMALNSKMLDFAFKIKPDFVCLVPEKRKELTTEGGLNLFSNFNFLKQGIRKLQSKGTKVSLFIDPKIENVKQALLLNADNIEIHTGKYCAFLQKKNKTKMKIELSKIKQVAIFAFTNKIGVHCGNGLDYISTKNIKKIKEITEFNIGHFIISESVFHGLNNVVKKFLKIIKK